MIKVSEDEECLKCSGAPFDCTCCSRMCEPYGYDEETGKAIYKDLYMPNYRKGMNDTQLMEYITEHISDLHPDDCGAINIWKSDYGCELVDIEWNDGFCAFDLEKVMNLIEERGTITRYEISEECSEGL